MKPLARGNSDFLMDRAMTKAAKHLPLAFGEVLELGRPKTIGRAVVELLALILGPSAVVVVLGAVL